MSNQIVTLLMAIAGLTSFIVVMSLNPLKK